MLQAFKLLSHAVWQVFGNFTKAFKITALPFLILCGPIFYLIMSNIQGFDTNRVSSDIEPSANSISAEQMSSIFGLIGLGGIVGVGVALWVIVAWHRFILLEESTRFILPKFNGRQILSYVWRIILIFLLFIPLYLVFFALTLIVTEASIINFVAFSLLAFANTCIYYIVLYRLSPVLPAAALGEKLSFGEAINATKGATFSFVVLGFSLALLSVLFSFAELLFIHSPFAVMIGVQSLFAWLIFVLNLSIITTIYGHYVEGRPLR